MIHKFLQIGIEPSPLKKTCNIKKKATAAPSKRTRGLGSSMGSKSDKKKERAVILQEVGSLRDASVGLSCKRRYDECWEKFQKQARMKFTASSRPEMVDQKLAAFLDVMFAEGEDLGRAQYMVAAVQFKLPHVRSPRQMKMPMTRQAMQGWRKMDPPRSEVLHAKSDDPRSPYDGTVLCAIFVRGR